MPEQKACASIVTVHVVNTAKARLGITVLGGTDNEIGAIFVKSVQLNSPAFLAGVKPFDRILAINGADVMAMTNIQGVDAIKAAPAQFDLVLLRSGEPALSAIAAELRKPASEFQIKTTFRHTAMPLVGHKTLRFATEGPIHQVTCQRIDGSFGCKLFGGSDTYIGAIMVSSDAIDTNGLKKGDRIIAVEGVNVLGFKLEQFTHLLKERLGTLTFLVMRLGAELFETIYQAGTAAEDEEVRLRQAEELKAKNAYLEAIPAEKPLVPQHLIGVNQHSEEFDGPLIIPQFDESNLSFGKALPKAAKVASDASATQQSKITEPISEVLPLYSQPTAAPQSTDEKVAVEETRIEHAATVSREASSRPVQIAEAEIPELKLQQDDIVAAPIVAESLVSGANSSEHQSVPLATRRQSSRVQFSAAATPHDKHSAQELAKPRRSFDFSLDDEPATHSHSAAGVGESNDKLEEPDHIVAVVGHQPQARTNRPSLDFSLDGLEDEVDDNDELITSDVESVDGLLAVVADASAPPSDNHQQQADVPSQPSLQELQTRLIAVHRINNSLGFSIAAIEQQTDSIFISNVTPSAEQAGLRVGDQILAIDGRDTSHLPEDQVLLMLKATPSPVTLLVANQPIKFAALADLAEKQKRPLSFRKSGSNIEQEQQSVHPSTVEAQQESRSNFQEKNIDISEAKTKVQSHDGVPSHASDDALAAAVKLEATVQAPENVAREVLVKRVDGVLGFVLMTRGNAANGPIYIKELRAAHAQSSGLLVGDRLLSVNNESIEGLSYDVVKNKLTACGTKPFPLRVVYEPEAQLVRAVNAASFQVVNRTSVKAHPQVCLFL